MLADPASNACSTHPNVGGWSIVDVPEEKIDARAIW